MVVNCRSKLQKFMIDDLFPDVEIPKPAVNAAAKTVVSFIPYLGNAISTIWNEFESAQLQRKVERFEELVKTLSNDLTRLETRVNQEYINKPDCADLLEKTVHNIVIERLEEKRLAYKNILINSIVDKNCDFDRTEKYISLLSQMTKIDILLLSTFLLSVFGRFIFGKRSALNNAVSSAIGILFIYAVTVVLNSAGAQYSSLIAPYLLLPSPVRTLHFSPLQVHTIL